jgi:hypothetical protein
MSVTDTVYVRELLELTGARDLYEDLGVEPDCTRVELVAALEKKRDWARRFPDDPVARWWTRHMVRTARMLVHDEPQRPKRHRQDDLQAAIKGAVLQGALGPEMRRLVIRMGERRGLDGAQVDAMIDHERRALEDLQKKIRTALGKGPEDEAREAIRAAMWGAMVAGNVSATVMAKIVERGCALGLDAETVKKVQDEVKAEWKVERDEALDTDLQGRWVPPHRRMPRDDAHRPAASETDGKWTLSDSLEDGLDDIVRGAAEDHGDLPELDLELELDPSEGIDKEDPSQGAWAEPKWPVNEFSERNGVTGASVLVSVRSVPPSLPSGFVEPASSLPPAVRRVAEPPSSTTLTSSVSPPKPEEPEGSAKPRARALALHTTLSTVAVMGGALYGVTWFLLANRTHLF